MVIEHIVTVSIG